ncbi:MAG: hypothetical protein IH593_12430, partial [Bacteroidales bacterium]|nr:hypothetical protein [Bacteroidales bacterium]
MRRRTITILFLFICLAGRVGVIAQGETKSDRALVITEDTSAVEPAAARHIKGARVSVPGGTGDINLDKGASLNYLQ